MNLLMTFDKNIAVTVQYEASIRLTVSFAKNVPVTINLENAINLVIHAS